MTRDEFIKKYNFGLSPEQQLENEIMLLPLPCACDYEGCDGWAMVRNNPDMIKDHYDLYAPISWKEKALEWRQHLGD